MPASGVAGIESPRKQFKQQQITGLPRCPVSCPQCPPIVKLWASIGLEAAADLRRVVRPWVPSAWLAHHSMPDVAASTEPNTSNHTPAAFFRAASQGARKVPPCLRPLVSAARRSNRPSHLGRCKPPRESGAGLFRNRLGLRGCRRRGSIEALDVAASVANTRRQGGYLALIGPAPTPFRPHKLAAPALKEWRGERRAESGGGESFRCTKESDAGHVVKGGGPWETSSTPPSPCNNPKSTAPPDWLALALPVPVNWV
jgi:hypothetical protein